MIYKVSELEGALLDAAVAKANGWSLHEHFGMRVWGDDTTKEAYPASAYQPSKNWLLAGLIIERERLQICCNGEEINDDWTGRTVHEMYYDVGVSGPTPLIAAMRCYVSSKFGDTVDLAI